MIPHAIHKHGWEIRPLEHLKVGKSGQTGRREGRSTEDTARSSLRSQERGGLRLQVHSLWPQQSFLRDQHIIQLNSVMGQWPEVKDQKLKCDNCGLTALTASKKTKPQSLAAFPQPPRPCLPHMLPVLAAGPRKTEAMMGYRAACLQAWELERKFQSSRCTLWLMPATREDRGKAAVVWQLPLLGREQSHKYTSSRFFQPTQPTPFPADCNKGHLEILRHTALHLAQGQHWDSGSQNPITHHMLPWGWCPETQQLGHRGDASLTRKSLTTLETRTGKNKIKCSNATYWKAK